MPSENIVWRQRGSDRNWNKVTLVTVALSHNPSIWKTETGKPEVWGQPRLHDDILFWMNKMK